MSTILPRVQATAIAFAVGCGDQEDREACVHRTDEEMEGSGSEGSGSEGSGSSSAAASPSTVPVDITWRAGDLESRPILGPVHIDGNVVAKVRIDRLLVGGRPVTAQRSNYADWSIDIPLEAIQGLRGDGDEFVDLPVTAYDVCEDRYQGEPVRVRVGAPVGSSAKGLTVVTTATQLNSEGAPECYLPANGAGLASVKVSADLGAAGVEVTLKSAVMGNFFGVANATVALSLENSDASQAVAPIVFFQPTAPGRLGVSASAGASYDLDESSILAAEAPPTFSGATGAVPRDVPLLVRVRTPGRLGRCYADSSRPDVLTVVASDGSSLLTNDLLLGVEVTCEQTEEMIVTFLATAPMGATVDITCEDTYGQATTRTLSAE